MKKGMNKKAQETFSLSFSMIFAIFLIAVSAFVAFYVIDHFLALNKCTQVGFFYDDLKSQVNQAWNSDPNGYSAQFTGSLPSMGIFKTKIEYACFGNLTQFGQTASDQEKQKSLKYESGLPFNSNVFLYPPNNACDRLASNSISHMYADKFFCANVTDGKVRVQIRNFNGIVKVSMS